MRSPEIFVSEEAGVRTLHFGSSWVQGAMRIARPFKLELSYTREMFLPLLLRDWADGPSRVLIVGLGAGSLAKYLHHHFQGSVVTVVEIEPLVHAAALQHFRFPPESDRLTVVYADAADFVQDCKDRFDLILVDGFDPHARMGRLCSDTFFSNCARLLVKDGLLSINLLSRRKEFSVCQRLIAAEFAEPLLLLPSLDAGNTLVIAGHQPFGVKHFVKDLDAPARALKAQTGLDLMPSLTSWASKGITPVET